MAPKQIRHQTANEQTDDHGRVGEREGDRLAGGFQCVRVVGEQHQRRQTGGADGIALVTALVVLPTASSGSVMLRILLGRFAISAIPPALSVIGRRRRARQ